MSTVTSSTTAGPYVPVNPSTTAGAVAAKTVTPITYAAGASNGVAMVAPPEAIMPSISAALKTVTAEIPAGHTNALVARVDLKGANVILAHRFGDSFRAMEYFGKTWDGGLEAGFQIMTSW